MDKFEEQMKMVGRLKDVLSSLKNRKEKYAYAKYRKMYVALLEEGEDIANRIHREFSGETDEQRDSE